MNNNGKKKIWIDLDNSPHVPFFKPIIEELKKRNYSVTVTARDCFQVCGLADKAQIPYKSFGRHYGKHVVLKILGMLLRTAQMAPSIIRERPTISVSHGSRTQQLLSSLLRIPNINIYDYEHSAALHIAPPAYVVVPEIISDSAIKFKKSRIYKYPGIKEDVYVPDFRPDPMIRLNLGLTVDDIVVTVRPPASEAHYRSPESEKLFQETIDFLSLHKMVRIVLLPRNEHQAVRIREQWPELFRKRMIIIPEKVVDGLNLIWHSDFVVSGGGTMNREAAALGVPVYSIFRGKTGAVDSYLAEQGRLTLLETPEDVRTKMLPVKRASGNNARMHDRAAFQRIMSIIEEAAHQ
jgi:hypothetical protein